MTVTVNEIEAIEALDFDLEDACENENGCDNTATWALVIFCCEQQKTQLLCDICKERAQWLIEISPVLRCYYCHTPVPKEQIEWTRIKA